MNIIEAFVEYLETLGVGTFGQNIFIAEAPSSNKVPAAIYWVTDNGGQPLVKNFTGEQIKQYTFFIYRRDRNYKLVKDALYNLEEQISCSGCFQLTGFETIEIEVISFPIDNDLDSEDRKVGLLQVNIKTHKSC
jgi:hypothetical protein